jgi:hypothetical protein
MAWWSYAHGQQEACPCLALDDPLRRGAAATVSTIGTHAVATCSSGLPAMQRPRHSSSGQSCASRAAVVCPGGPHRPCVPGEAPPVLPPPYATPSVMHFSDHHRLAAGSHADRAGGIHRDMLGGWTRLFPLASRAAGRCGPGGRGAHADEARQGSRGDTAAGRLPGDGTQRRSHHAVARRRWRRPCRAPRRLPRKPEPAVRHGAGRRSALRRHDGCRDAISTAPARPA